MFTNWEVVRKVRSPEEETAYTTYSKIFGPRPAILIALTLQIIFNGVVLAIFQQLHSPAILSLLFCMAQLILMSPSLYFLFTLKLRRPLTPFAEAQILVVVGSLFLAALL